jgi:UDP-N-acetyl-D-galactosamine dehydrogenase
MNELALIFDRLEISTRDVLEAAGTKWNFLPFTPGLVGGHCIGVDPYYLTAKAEAVGYHPEVILAGRRINDDMGKFIAQRTVKLLRKQDHDLKGARIGVLGLTFKENVPDLRNSRVPDIIHELREYGIEPIIHDPLASSEEALREYGLELRPFDALNELHGVILAVPHRQYAERLDRVVDCVCEGGLLIDVKSILNPRELRSDILYWSL